MGLARKLLLAGLSGCLVMLVWITAGTVDSLFGSLVFYGVTGAIFSAGVLLPYLRTGDVASLRVPALVLVSALSFFAAIFAAGEWGSGTWGPDLEDYTVASLVGAAIVLLAAPWLLRLRYSLRLLLASIPAALAGGLLFWVFEELFPGSLMLSFAMWHMTVAIAIHAADPVVAAERWLASVHPKRFRIVVAILCLVVALPFVIDGIGALLQRYYAAEQGGVFIHEQVSAGGFRDERPKPWFNSGCQFKCVDLLREGTYAFQEYSVSTDEGGYLRFFIAARPEKNCHNYGGDWNPPLAVTWTMTDRIGEGRCLSYEVSDIPQAEYAIRSSTESVYALFGFYRLTKTLRQAVRLSDESVVAEVIYFEYQSMLLGGSSGTVESWKDDIKRLLPPAIAR